MRKNIGNIDRAIRFFIAISLFAILASEITFGLFPYVILAVAMIIAVTALVGSCPLYSHFYFSTRKMRKSI